MKIIKMMIIRTTTTTTIIIIKNTYSHTCIFMLGILNNRNQYL